MTRHVTVELTEAQAAVLDSEAAREAKPIEAVVTELIQRRVDYDVWFRAQVREGLDEAERGEGIPHEKVVARAARRRDELLARNANR